MTFSFHTPMLRYLHLGVRLLRYPSVSFVRAAINIFIIRDRVISMTFRCVVEILASISSYKTACAISARFHLRVTC